MKPIYLIAAVVLSVLVACNNQQPAAEENTKVVEKEVVKEVKVEKPVEKEKVVVVERPAEKKVVVEEEKSTSIKIGSDGASVKSKKIDIDFNTK